MTTNLKPCPKCHGMANIHRMPYTHSDFERIVGICRQCGHQTEQGVIVPKGATMEELLTAAKIAATRWNQRHGQP